MSFLMRSEALDGLSDIDLDMVETVAHRYARGEILGTEWRKFVRDLMARRPVLPEPRASHAHGAPLRGGW